MFGSPIGDGLETKTQNLYEACTSGKKTFLFSKSYSAFNRPSVDTPLKNRAASEDRLWPQTEDEQPCFHLCCINGMIISYTWRPTWGLLVRPSP